jgi:hypothetical protein
MDEEQKRPAVPPEPPAEAEKPAEHPEQTTGGTGITPQQGVPNPGFTARGD